MEVKENETNKAAAPVDDGSSISLAPHFLPDKPLAVDEADGVRFGHEAIAEALAKIVTKCPAPFTIGLFGKWGSGKSTVLKQAEPYLSNTEIVEFDVWKYEHDSLRRQFLITCDEKLSLELGFKETLNQSLSEPIAPGLREYIKKNLQSLSNRLLFNALCLLSATAVLVGLVIKYPPLSYLWIPMFTGIAFALFSSDFILKSVDNLYKTATHHRTDSAEGFEDKFKEVLRARKKKNKSNKRLLVVFDNLDRAGDDKAVEALSTIKTFLDVEAQENGEVVYLVPCDDQAIKKHLEKLYPEKDPDEFLKKFFNVSLTIPEFIYLDLYSYVDEQLVQTGLPKLVDNDVALVIAAAFRANPRQINQFINQLTAHFLLAEEREARGLIKTSGLLTGNPGFLARVLVIQTRFADAYRKIIDDDLTIDQLESADDKPEYRDFLKATRPIGAPALRPFIYFKQSDDELRFEHADDLMICLQELRPEELANIVKNSRSQIKVVQKLSLDYIKKLQNLDIKTLAISTVITVDKLLEGIFSRDFFRAIGDVLAYDLAGHVGSLDPSDVFEIVLTKCLKADRNRILKHYFSLLRTLAGEAPNQPSQPTIIQIFSQLKMHKQWLDREQKAEVAAIVNDIFATDMTVLSLFVDDPDDAKTFVNEGSLTKFVESFSPSDVENSTISDKTSLAIQLAGVAGAPVARNVLDNIRELLESEKTQGFRAQKETLLDEANKLLRAFEPVIGQKPDKSSIDALAESVFEAATGETEIPRQRIFIALSLWLKKRVGPETHDKLNGLIREFLTNVDAAALQSLIRQLGDDAKELVQTDYPDVFASRLTYPGILETAYGVASDDQRVLWLVDLIKNSDWEMGLAGLEAESYRTTDANAIVTALLGRAQEMGHEQKARFYGAVNALKCAGDDVLIQQFAQQIEALLQNDEDHNAQKVAQDAWLAADYLPSAVRGTVARNTIAWLRESGRNPYQPGAVNTILAHWKDIEKSATRDLIDFAFYQLAYQGDSSEAIRLGFQVLSQARPKPGLNKQNLNHYQRLANRLMVEEREAIKVELSQGLKQLIPGNKPRSADLAQVWGEIKAALNEGRE